MSEERLRHEARAGAPAIGGERLCGKPRPIMREDANEPRGDRVRAGAGRVDGKVAALGVPSHVERALHQARDALKIVRRGTLRGHAGLEGHVEVLSPAHQRVVGPTKGDVGAARGKEQRAGGELLLGRLVEVLDVVADASPAQAGARRHADEQAREAVRVPEALRHPGDPVGAEQVGHGHALGAPCRRGLGREAVVRGARERQAVHVAERALVKRLELASEVPEDVLFVRREER